MMIPKNYTIRDNCIFCNAPLSDTFFDVDGWTFAGHYPLEAGEVGVKVPFNVCVCPHCKTPQNKYLASLSEVYRRNHADSTGVVMTNLHLKVVDIVLKYQRIIHNIIEIGCAKGILADHILNQIPMKYYAIEPNFFGNPANKIVIPSYYEHVQDEMLDADTIIISHVFEHFYKPMDIVRKIANNMNIKNLFLIFPNLEYYINNNILHVLNAEHTFYADNQFLINLFGSFGFRLIESIDHVNHSVILFFQRREEVLSSYTPIFYNTNYDLSTYFGRIYSTVRKFNEILEENKGRKVFLFPASTHSSYLFSFGLNYNKLSGMLDNSPNKINKKLYGTDLDILPFMQTIEKERGALILMNGGVFNAEVEQSIKDSGCEYYIHKF